MKAAYREEYQAKDKEVKKQLRRDRRTWDDQIASDAAKAVKLGNIKAVFDDTRQLCNKPNHRTGAVRSKEGILLKQMEKARERWKEFFNKVLKRTAPADTTALNGACDELEILECVLLHMLRSEQPCNK